MNRRSRLLAAAALLVAVSLGCLAVPQLTTTTQPPAAVTAVVEPTTIPETAAPATAAPLVVAPPDGALQDLQSQVEAVYAAVGDSVVNISVTSIGYDMFRNAVPQEGTGSGFVFDADGNIVTNYHVVEGADEISVTFADGSTFPAKVVGQDPTYDLAVVQVDPTVHALVPVGLGSSESLRIGQFVVAIGAPFGLDQSVTFGVISSLGRVIESPDQRYIGEAIQTDAAINPGNSGGPLLDLEGRVIGVNAQIISPSQANAGIGFAIPVRLVKLVIPDLIANGTYRHPWMGVGPATMTQQLAQIMRDNGYDVPDQGVYIYQVSDGSGAANAGIQGPERDINYRGTRLPVGGDVVVALDGTPVTSSRDFIAYLETNTRPGDTVQVEVNRNGQTLTLDVVLGERPANQ